ncbi:MAG: shikimate kinase [Actinomycetota bacterium]|nr:shikimate kinase [Actinomycetota bacterium]
MIRADQHLVLVGMMGVGKTTVARVVADRLGRRVFDSDAIIESRQGRTVREIFTDDGEEAFRALETEVLLEALASPEPVVVAGAGGVVLSAANREALKSSGARVVWLCADPATLVERVKSGGHRPLLDDDPAGTLQRMFRDREALYREVADAIVLVDNRSIGDVVEAVLR